MQLIKESLPLILSGLRQSKSLGTPAQVPSLSLSSNGGRPRDESVVHPRRELPSVQTSNLPHPPPPPRREFQGRDWRGSSRNRNEDYENLMTLTMIKRTLEFDATTCSQRYPCF